MERTSSRSVIMGRIIDDLHDMARWIMSKHLGRALTKDEIVHHKDGDVTNYDLDNLELMTRSAHTSFHMKRRKPSKSWFKFGRPATIGNTGQNHSKETKEKIRLSLLKTAHEKALRRACEMYPEMIKKN